MKTKNKNLLVKYLAGIGALGVIATASAASTQTNSTNIEHGKFNIEVRQALDKGDYQAFLVATKNKPASAQTITEEQFRAIVQANKLISAGDVTGAKKLLDETGVKDPVNHSRIGERGGSRGIRGGGVGMSNLTDSQKETMNKAHDLFLSGKNAEAKTLLDNAGIKDVKHDSIVASSSSFGARVKGFVSGMFHRSATSTTTTK